MTNKMEYYRPWGYFQILSDELDHKVKRIVVHPKKRLSLQRHNKRSEHWYILSGEAIVTKNNESIFLKQKESTNIPVRCKHRIMNPGTDNLTFIEIQTGNYFGEDDIERFEDDYGRV